MLKADSARNRLIGIALVSLCYVLFTLLDGAAKWLVASVPVIVVVWLRFLIHAIFASALLLPLRGKALVTEYRPGTELGWHRDVGEFGIVAGVSLAGTCRMRFRRYPPEKGAKVFGLDLAPRSVYVLRDEIRWRWQHSVARTKELRYSITFRTSR